MTKRFDRGRRICDFTCSHCARSTTSTSSRSHHSYSLFPRRGKIGLNASDRDQIFRRSRSNVMGVNHDDPHEECPFYFLRMVSGIDTRPMT